MQNILITGANRGIGFALVEQYLAEGSSADLRHLPAIPKAPKPERPGAREPAALANPAIGRRRREASIRGAVNAIAGETGSLDVLINNAGISGGDGARNMGQLTSAEVAAVITTNAVAPLIVTQACRDLLQQGGQSARGHDLVRHGLPGRCRRQCLRLPHEQGGDEYGGARPGA